MASVLELGVECLGIVGELLEAIASDWANVCWLRREVVGGWRGGVFTGWRGYGWRLGVGGKTWVLTGVVGIEDFGAMNRTLRLLDREK